MKLDPADRDLLQQVLAAHGRGNSLLHGILERPRLSEREIELLCEVISAEFLATGLGPYHEPNARGLMLETLLDQVNRLRLRAGKWM